LTDLVQIVLVVVVLVALRAHIARPVVIVIALYGGPSAPLPVVATFAYDSTLGLSPVLQQLFAVPAIISAFASPMNGTFF